MEVWEAAAATSAASSYFKPFYHHASARSYLDGGLYYNNPVMIAHKEMRMLWPDVDQPDILLSIGTGQNRMRMEQESAAML
jgi:patatin-like phospholipase/acyl hydrolase